MLCQIRNLFLIEGATRETAFTQGAFQPEVGITTCNDEERDPLLIRFPMAAGWRYLERHAGGPTDAFADTADAIASPAAGRGKDGGLSFDGIAATCTAFRGMIDPLPPRHPKPVPNRHDGTPFT